MTPTRRRGRPRQPPTKLISIRLPQGLVEAVEAWRAQQPVPPGTSATFGHLINLGLAAANERISRP